MDGTPASEKETDLLFRRINIIYYHDTSCDAHTAEVSNCDTSQYLLAIFKLENSIPDSKIIQLVK